MRPARAVALDLGSTRIKCAVLGADETLGEIRARPAPPLRGVDEIREGDALEYVGVAEQLLAELAREVPAGTPLGIASQRSTFLLWDRERGVPLTPLISWQDRRAADWCARHARYAASVTRCTGLALSAHYVGPKLATLLEREPAGGALREANVRFGTLDSFLVWRLSGGAVHEIDGTMAARTAMLDLASGDWSPGLLRLFGVTRRLLPRVRPTSRRGPRLPIGLVPTATIADQAAGALALLEPGCDTVVVSLGTGAFVLRPAAGPDARLPGYLTAPIRFDEARGASLHVLEGTVNGSGPAVDRFGPGPTELPSRDPSPDAFCLPDSAGLGSPYWRPELDLRLSSAARRAAPADRRRVVLEGLLFRVLEILDDLCRGASPPPRVVLVGGLSREPFLARGLAALLGRPVERLELAEGVLIGAARLAAGLDPHGEAAALCVAPGRAGGYLVEKYGRWRDWLSELLRGAADGGARKITRR